MDENNDPSGFAKVDAMADRPASTTPQAQDEPMPAQDDASPRPLEPTGGAVADEPTDEGLSDSELRRNAVVAQLTEIRAKVLQAKRQNMLDGLADAVADLVTLMLDGAA